MTLLRHKNRDAWLAWRGADHRIGGTDACAILRQSTWSSPWDVYARHRGLPTTAGPDAATSARGLRYEAPARDVYEERTGLYVDADLMTIEHPETPWAFASVDGLVLTECVMGVLLGDPVGMIEIKTVSRSDLGYLWSDDDPEPAWVRQLDGLVVPAWDSDEAARLPSSWLAQIQWYLECTRLDWCDLVILGPHIDDCQIVRVLRDAETGAAMLRSVAAWRERHLLGDEVPALDGSDACATWARGVWLETPRTVTVEAPAGLAEMVDEFGAAKSTIRACEAIVKLARAHILTAAADLGAQRITTGDYVVSINKAGAVSAKERKS